METAITTPLQGSTVFTQSRRLFPNHHHSSPSTNTNPNSIILGVSNPRKFLFSSPQSIHSSRLGLLCCSSSSSKRSDVKSTMANHLLSEAPVDLESGSQIRWNVEVGNPNVGSLRVWPAKFSLSDQAFFLLAFIACTTTVAFTSFVIAAVPTLHAMGRAATSFAKLADTARLELPSTMAAMRLSSMEISDLTLELSDLSQEVADGVHRSAQAVQAAKAGIQHIGARTRQQTISMIQERASLPIISLQPVVAGAAEKTSRAVAQARKTLMNIISRPSAENKDESVINRLEI